MPGIGVFKTATAKDVLRATRRVLGAVGTKLGVLERVGRGVGGGASGSTSSTDADSSCDCETCIEGTDIPDADPLTGCCKASMQWEVANPWTLAGATMTLEYIGGDQWLSQSFTGAGAWPDSAGVGEFGDLYRWLLKVDTQGTSTLTLTRETNNGDPDVCVVYGRESFDCQCTNSFSLLKPHGKWAGIQRSYFSCTACLQPVSVFADLGTGEDFLPPEVVGNQDWCRQGNREFAQVAHVVVGTVGNDFYEGCHRAGGLHVLVGDAAASGLSSCGTEVGTFCQWDKYGACEFFSDVRVPVGTCTGISTTNFFHGTAKQVRVSAGVTYNNFNQRAKVAISIVRSTTGGSARQIVEYTNEQWDGGDVIVLPRTRYVGCGDTDAECCTSTGEDDADATKYLCNFPASVTLYLNWSIVEQSDEAPEPISPTETGACADICEKTETPPDEDNGGCCLAGWCYDYLTQPLCADFGGTWEADGCADCEQLWACCLGTSCTEADAYDCELLGGTLLDGQKCVDVPCDTGACCRSTTGSCEDDVSAAECTAPDYFAGSGTVCSDSPCASVGACCHNNGAGTNCSADCVCELMSNADCDALDVSGTSSYAGDGTYCGGPGAVDCDCRGLNCDFL